MFRRVMRYRMWSDTKDKLIQEELHYGNSSLIYSSVESGVMAGVSSGLLG